MEGLDGSPPSSLWMVRAAELYPKPVIEKEDDKLTVPFQELAGESVKYLGRTDDGVLALSNYRLFLLKNSTYSETSVPLGLIESAQVRDLFHLIISCKDASTVKCSFPTSEQCSEWQRRISLSVGVPENLESMFAFPFYSWVTESASTDCNEWAGRLLRAGRFESDFRKDVDRLQFDLNTTWRISEANADFKLCPSYPTLLLVPCCISEETLQNVASFRSSRRIPAVVWRHKQSGAVIARCSQPEVGWLGWRNAKDEQLLKALADACAFDRGEQSRRQNLNASGDSTPSSNEGSHEEVSLDEVKKVLIVDARSYTSAVTNRARGGGCECAEYYPCAEIQFMSLGNIHAIRKSFHALRQLCASPPDIPNWLGLLERTMWLQHLSGLLAASMTVCHAIERNGRPVLVHCSDGWDRTPQIVATAQLCLDPYYRTVEGFRVLVDREWLSFGHKFADRCGHGPGSDELNERCPVFLQWLDVVSQIHRQFTCSFEFSMAYLIKLAQHSHSCLFGTFLCNTIKERIENSVFDRTFSVWPFLSGPMYKNPLYVPNKEKVLWPAHNVRDLVVWSEVYLGSLGNQNSSDFPPNTMDNNQESMSPMTKTRSYGDLISAGNLQNGLTRRSSDPNMTVESHLMTPLNLSADNSIVDSSSDRGGSPDIISQSTVNMFHDMTEKVQNLTNELNQSDEDVDIKMYNTNGQTSSDFLVTSQLFEHSNLKHYDVKRSGCNSVSNASIASNVVNVDSFVITTKNTHQTNSSPTCNDVQFNINSSDSIDNRLGNNDFKTKKKQNIAEYFDDKIDSAAESSKDEIDGDKNKTISVYNDCGSVRNRTSSKVNSFDATKILTCDEENCNGEFITDVDISDLEIAQSIDFRESLSNNSPMNSIQSQNLCHDSIDTSTDTLVPIESLQLQKEEYFKLENENEEDQTHQQNQLKSTLTSSTHRMQQDQTKTTASLLSESNNQEEHTPLNAVEVPTYINNNIKNNNNINSHINNTEQNTIQLGKEKMLTNSLYKDLPEVHCRTKSITKNIYNNLSAMDESIIIQPEHQKLEISNNGRCDSVVNNIINTTSSHRRRRTSSINSKNQDIISPNKMFNGSTSSSATNSRFSTPGARSLPLTPPGIPDRPSVAISCPDGLAHALSEQNIRLQQIVYEHKLREDALQRELYGMRMALLKKTCPHCNNQPLLNDEHTTALDSIENASICSREAVEDRSGSLSGADNSQPASTVLWVPDHAVSKCTGCQTDFWIGRRKHHCRSCGQIFCADCSEFWAPLPDERLYSPVRLCGPCYHIVTTRIQQQSRPGSSSNCQQIALSSSSTSSMVASTAISLHSTSNNCSITSTAIEACKHAANPTHNERGHLKATAAFN